MYFTKAFHDKPNWMQSFRRERCGDRELCGWNNNKRSDTRQVPTRGKPSKLAGKQLIILVNGYCFRIQPSFSVAYLPIYLFKPQGAGGVRKVFWWSTLLRGGFHSQIRSNCGSIEEKVNSLELDPSCCAAMRSPLLIFCKSKVNEPGTQSISQLKWITQNLVYLELNLDFRK